ncbi:hypothetical protein C2845_PM05G07890 [Panicum miliaceum]|uniref:Uncharacterized protein n=1 Tax=Panicum miliaceum TaxID=4540 RepID=A0A3L6SVT0_PANMI|nr:hypothetical protein C2845_PM05G07890 [Panicum miliaceum]
MALQGLVDWRGRPVNHKKHGGVRASLFIHSQVFVAAFRKRKLPLPENLMEMPDQVTDGTGTSIELMERTAGFE